MCIHMWCYINDQKVVVSFFLKILRQQLADIDHFLMLSFIQYLFLITSTFLNAPMKREQLWYFGLELEFNNLLLLSSGHFTESFDICLVNKVLMKLQNIYVCHHNFKFNVLSWLWTFFEGCFYFDKVLQFQNLWWLYCYQICYLQL